MNPFEFNIFVAIVGSMALLASAIVFWINFNLPIQVWFLNMRWKFTSLREKLVIWLASLLPAWLVYQCVIRAGVYATTGRFSNQNVPELTLMDALKRWSDRSK